MSERAPAMRRALFALARREDLSAEHTTEVFSEVMAGACDEVEIGALLMGLAVKGETTDELVGLVTAMRGTVTRVPVPTRLAIAGAGPVEPVVDVCGTGGSGVRRVNVSTAVAIAVASCGVPVAKHGNRAASSKSGSADVLEALGIAIDDGPEAVARAIETVGVGFLFARALHPAAGRAARVRQVLGVRTLFNLAGPLCNPAFVVRQVVGVYDPRRCESVAAALGQLGSERVFVTHGFDEGARASHDAPPGIDDLSLSGESLVCEWTGREVVQHVLVPEDAGLARHPWAALQGGDPATNAARLRALLSGDDAGARADRGLSAYLDAVSYAGALALVCAGQGGLEQLAAQARRIREAITSGRARAVLRAWCSLAALATPR